MFNDGDVKWVPVRTAAKMLGVTMARVYQLLEIGELTSMKLDLTTLVGLRSIEARKMMGRRGGKRAA